MLLILVNFHPSFCFINIGKFIVTFFWKNIWNMSCSPSKYIGFSLIYLNFTCFSLYACYFLYFQNESQGSKSTSHYQWLQSMKRHLQHKWGHAATRIHPCSSESGWDGSCMLIATLPALWECGLVALDKKSVMPSHGCSLRHHPHWKNAWLCTVT